MTHDCLQRFKVERTGFGVDSVSKLFAKVAGAK